MRRLIGPSRCGRGGCVAHVPVVGSQMRTVQSLLAVARRGVPLWVNAQTDRTPSVWPWKVRWHVPVVGSQIRTVQSPLAVARRGPHPLRTRTQTERVGPSWPWRVRRWAPVAGSKSVRYRPHLRWRGGCAVCGGDGAHVGDRASVAMEDMVLCAGGRVPNAGGAVVAGSCDEGSAA